MRRRVAVERTLSGVGEILQRRGYEVVSLDPLSEPGAELRNCQAIVVSGRDENVLGMQDIQTTSSVIDARGLDLEEIVERVEQSFQLQERRT
ncbi:YkuS family protein [Calderihabitans maritimus]|uniref:YkuS family protein n=1 Tax=Calderihabitans maritimus TaxID=1246530 RepID=A0A1Z5HQJ7_9FIRM|nr:YkuS family protein [Calderihabitans maritimus]GAW91799.1 hypothetical protein TherJR_2594 [Calderihabitans maritimus]